jgi:O-antigen/teichoic acid export membrane protein
VSIQARIRAVRVQHAIRRLSALIRHGPILKNLAGTVAVQLALLVSGTLSARMLGPTNRGYLAFLVTSASTIGQVGAVGVSLSATYQLATGRMSGAEVIRLIRRPVVIQILTLTTINACVVIGYTLVTRAPIFIAAALSLIQMPAACGYDTGIALALGARRHGVASSARTVPGLLYALALVPLFLAEAGTLDRVVACFVIASSTGGALALIRGVRVARTISSSDSIVPKIGAKAARRELLAFGRRGYVGYLAPTDTFRIDQLIVAFLLSPRALGLYAVGAAFTGFTRVLAANVGMSGTSEIAQHGEGEEQRAAVRRMLLVSAGLLGAVTVGVCAISPFVIPALFGNAFRASIPLSECLVVASLFLSMKRIAVDLLRGAGELKMGTRAEVINMAGLLILAVPAALLLGGFGVALSLAVSGASGTLYLLLQMRRLGFV